MFSEVITLLTLIDSKDAADNLTQEVICEHDVFAELKSVGMKEFYQSAAVGFKPELVFKIADYLDYNNERFIAYNCIRYNVIRTYKIRESSEFEIVVSSIVNNGGAPYALT